MESRSLKDELLHYFDYDVNTPSNSSFNQRRSQLFQRHLNSFFMSLTIVSLKAGSDMVYSWLPVMAPN